MIHECMFITCIIKRKVANVRDVKGVERKEGIAGRSEDCEVGEECMTLTQQEGNCPRAVIILLLLLFANNICILYVCVCMRENVACAARACNLATTSYR